MTKTESVKLDLSPLAAACMSIANDAADDRGFVPMCELIKRFRAQLILRPLLAEGLLAKLGSHSWAVLIDNEKYPLTLDDVNAETPDKPLPARMRFTIAHELAHSLAFRTDELGLKLAIEVDKVPRTAFVEAVERETDKLSSLLLWPQKAVEAFLMAQSQPPTADQLARQAQSQGISRQALISRLRHFQQADTQRCLQNPALRNFGIGVAEWVEGGEAVLRTWPIFRNFDREIVPQLLLRAGTQERLPAKAVIPHADFVLCGGSEIRTEFLSDAGLPRVPDAETMWVHVNAETGVRRVGYSSIYVIQKGVAPANDRVPLKSSGQGELLG